MAEALIRHRERVADGESASVARGAEAAADHLDLARLVVGRVLEQVDAGTSTPTIRDGLAAARILAEVGPDPLSDPEETVQVFIAWMRAIQAETTAEQLQRIGRRIEGSSIIQALQARADRGLKESS